MCCANYVKSYYICKVIFMLPDAIFMLLLCYLILLGRVEPPTKFSKRGDLAGPQLIVGGLLGKRGGDIFQGGGGQFSHKK